MDSQIGLSSGFIERWHTQDLSEDLNQIVQVLGFKRCRNNPEQVMLNISDGVHKMSAYIPFSIFESSRIAVYSILKVTKIKRKVIDSKALAIIESISETHNENLHKMGEPLKYSMLVQTKDVAPPPTEDSAPAPTDTHENSEAMDVSQEEHLDDVIENRMEDGEEFVAVSISQISQSSSKSSKFIGKIYQKSTIWESADGVKVFSAGLMDKTGEIRICFNGQLASKYFDLIQETQVYSIRNFDVKVKPPNYSDVNHNFELYCSTQTTIQHVLNDAELKDLSPIPNALMKLVDLNIIDKNKFVSILAVVTGISGLSNIKSANSNKMNTVLDLYVVDASRLTPVLLKLWNELAIEFEKQLKIGTVIFAKGLKIYETYYKARNLTTQAQSTLLVSPKQLEKEQQQLADWFMKNKRNFGLPGTFIMPSTPLAQASPVPVPQEQTQTLDIPGAGPFLTRLSMGKKPFVWKTLAKIVKLQPLIKEIFYFTCCEKRNGVQCSGDVNFEGPLFHCQKCDKIVPSPLIRYKIKMEIKNEEHIDLLKGIGYDVAGRFLFHDTAPNTFERFKNLDEFNVASQIDLILNKDYLFKIRSIRLEESLIIHNIIDMSDV